MYYVQNIIRMENRKLYNLSRLREMICDDNEIRELNKLFIKTASTTVTAMNTAYAKKDYVKLSELAHKLKSCVKLWDINQIADDIASLEKSGKTLANLDQFPIWLDKVNNVINQVVTQLEKELESPKSKFSFT